MAGYKIGRSKRAEDYPPTCPECGRNVRPPRAPKELFPGTLAAIRADGTCSSCIHKANIAGTIPKRKVAGPHTRKQEPTVIPPAQQAYNLAGYISWRKRRESRGAPDEGFNVDTLRKPGLFSWEIE